jgi:hypothetical protein
MHLCQTLNSNVRIARGQCIDGVQDQEAYYPLLDALGRLAHDQGVIEALHSHAPSWLLQFPSLLNETERQQWRLEGSHVARRRMLREVCELLDSLTREFPLLLSLEDLLWADSSTMSCISALARRREPARLMLLLTYRPVDAILTRHPDYLEDHHLLIVNDNVLEMSLPLDLASMVPESLRQIIDKTFDELVDDEAEALTVASAIGIEFDAWAVAAVMKCQVSEMESRFDALAQRQMFIESAPNAAVPDDTRCSSSIALGTLYIAKSCTAGVVSRPGSASTSDS